MCLSKTVAANTVEADLTCIDVAFLDNVSPATQETAWVTHIQLNKQQTLFKLDTGAEVTAISGSTHQSLGKPTLDTPDKTLYGPSRLPLPVLGQFKRTFTHKGRQSQQQVFVVDGLKSNLLGLPAITALHLTARIETAEHSETTADTTYMQRFPKVFQGLGNLGEEFTITKTRCHPSRTLYATQRPSTTPTEGRGAPSNGVHGSHLEGRRTNSLVCGYGCCTKEIWQGPHKRRPQTPQRKCTFPEENISNPGRSRWSSARWMTSSYLEALTQSTMLDSLQF